MKIPATIDSAMWEVVESGNQALMDEFADRYPEYKSELAKRVTMMRELRSSKPAPASKPAFRPRANVQEFEPARRWSTPTLIVTIAATAAASLAIYRLIETRPQSTAVIVPPVNTNPQPSTDMRLYQPDPKPQQAPVQPDANTGDQDTTPPKDPSRNDFFQKPVNLSAENVPLSSVLQDLATQANLVLEAAPKMPNPMIRATYVNTPAINVLEDLGRNFGFTPFRQGPRSALLVPARDAGTGGGQNPNGTPAPQTGGNPTLEGPVNTRGGGLGPLPAVGE